MLPLSERKLKNKTEIIIGINLGYSEDSLDTLHKMIGSKAHIYCNPRGFFHPKMYIIKISNDQGIIIVGSSNFTEPGFFNNVEVNLALELNLNEKVEKKIFEEARDLFNKIKNSVSTKPLTKNLIKRLNKTKIPKEQIFPLKRKVKKLSEIFKSDEKEIVNKLSKIFKSDKIDFEALTNFVMTLSYNDVSGVRGDKYIRIPKCAIEKNGFFWGWNNKFTPSKKAGNPERFITIKYKNKIYKYRLYYVDGPKEFRLVFPQIYTLGKNFQGSILLTGKTNGSYVVKLIKKGSKKYKNLLGCCTETAPRGTAKVSKKWGYI